MKNIYKVAALVGILFGSFVGIASASPETEPGPVNDSLVESIVKSGAPSNDVLTLPLTVISVPRHHATPAQKKRLVCGEMHPIATGGAVRDCEWK